MAVPASEPAVPVRTGVGPVVLIGAIPAGPAGMGVVGLPGGVAYVDPARPDLPVHTVLHEPDRALPAVAELYGPAVAVAVVSAGETPVEVLLVESPAAGLVRRAGIADWLRTSSPDVLPGPLLDLEIGIAAVEPELDTGDGDDLAVDLLRRHVERVVRMAQRLRDPDLRGPGMAGPPPGFAELVAAAVDASAVVVGIGSRAHADLEHERELLAAARHLGLPVQALSWADLADLPQTADRTLAAAGHAGETATAARASVDWRLVPRGVLATGEDTVEWTVSDAELVVAVAAAAGAPDRRTLAFRAYAAGRSIPVVLGRLRRSADGARFVGRARLPTHVAPTEPLTIDIYDTGVHAKPLFGVDATAAKAERWAVRGLTLLRFGDAAAEADRIAAAALGEAAAQYGAVVATQSDPERRDRALRRQAVCVAVRRAALGRLGQERQAAAIGRAWSAGGVLTVADVAVPDLGGAGWAPLAAERAFAADPRWWG